MRQFLVMLLAAALFATVPALAQESAVPQKIGEVRAADVRTPTFQPTESNRRVFWQHEFIETGSKSVRIHFAHVTAPPDLAVELLLQDQDGAIVERFSGAALAALGETWSTVIPGRSVLVSLVGEESPVGVELVIDAIARTTTPGVALSIIGMSELQDIFEYATDAQISRLAAPVARLSFIANGEQFVCTGFMISPDRLMTNEHCVNSDTVCSTTLATFDFQRRADGSVQQGATFRCARLLIADPVLDMAVLQLNAPAGQTQGVLQLLPDAVAADDTLFIIQHPGGRPKMISKIECAVRTPIADGLGSQTDIGHRCDTEGGSSGSPIFDGNGQVIALHHFGVGAPPFGDQNRGVRMSLILSRLAGAGLL